MENWDRILFRCRWAWAQRHGSHRCDRCYIWFRFPAVWQWFWRQSHLAGCHRSQRRRDVAAVRRTQVWHRIGAMNGTHGLWMEEKKNLISIHWLMTVIGEMHEGRLTDGALPECSWALFAHNFPRSIDHASVCGLTLTGGHLKSRFDHVSRCNQRRRRNTWNMKGWRSNMFCLSMFCKV